MAVLPGRPAELSTRAASLVRSAEVILDVIAQMRGIAADDEGKAVEALHQQNEQISRDLERVHPRYKGTADALTEYAVALSDAHAKAERADDDLDTAVAARETAGSNLRDVERAVEASDDPASSPLADNLPGLRRLVSNAQSDIDDALALLDEARADMDDAAEAAIRRIDAAIDATNEGFWDGVGDFFSDIGDFLAGIGEWIGDFLQGVVDLLQAIADSIVAILGTLLVLLLVFALLGSGLLAALVVGALAAFLLASILSDVLQPTPKVTPFEPYRAPEDEPDPQTLQNVLDGTGEVDSLGGKGNSVIKITKVLGPDGWYYTVTLPSTQEWLSRFGDQGAVNDLDSNLALILTPALQTQYERAVLDAMADAGIGADDPVMLVGFSQGGIMAGHLVSYNSDYNWQAVIASGAPIDHMPIPGDVDVVSVQHNGDPVPNLDIIAGDLGTQHGPNWTTISVDPPTPNPVLGVDVDAHNAEAYSSTYQQHLADVQANHPDLAHFFAEDGYVDTSYYQWNE